LAAGLLGGGGAWIAGPGGGPGVALAEAPRQSEAAKTTQRNASGTDDKPRAAAEGQGRLVDLMQKMQGRIARKERDVHAIEDDWTSPGVGARLKLMAAEDRLKQIEKKRDTTFDNTAYLAALEHELANLESKKQELELAHGANHPNLLIAWNRIDTLKNHMSR